MFVRAEKMSDPYFRLVLESCFNIGFKTSLKGYDVATENLQLVITFLEIMLALGEKMS